MAGFDLDFRVSIVRHLDWHDHRFSYKVILWALDSFPIWGNGFSLDGQTVQWAGGVLVDM